METKKVTYYAQVWPGWSTEHPPSLFHERPDRLYDPANRVIAIEVELPVLRPPFETVKAKVTDITDNPTPNHEGKE